MEDESAAAVRGEAARGRGRVMDGSAAMAREGRGSHGERRAVNELTARGGEGRMGMNESGAVVRGGEGGRWGWVVDEPAAVVRGEAVREEGGR